MFFAKLKPKKPNPNHNKKKNKISESRAQYLCSKYFKELFFQKQINLYTQTRRYLGSLLSFTARESKKKSNLVLIAHQDTKNNGRNDDITLLDTSMFGFDFSFLQLPVGSAAWSQEMWLKTLNFIWYLKIQMQFHMIPINTWWIDINLHLY